MSNAKKDKAADAAIAEAKEAKPYTDKVKFGRVASPPPQFSINEYDLDEKLPDVVMTIVEPGLVGSNAILQGIEFKDGKSVVPATRRQIDRIAASLRVSIEGGDEDGEDFKTVSQRINDRTTQIERDEKLERDVTVVSVKPAKGGKKLWTQAELSAIADDKGINGLREIADPLKLRSRSIPELIGKIMEAIGVEQPVKEEEVFSEADKPVAELEADEDDAPVIETPAEPVVETPDEPVVETPAEPVVEPETPAEAEVKADEDAPSDGEAKPDAVETADVKPEGSETDGKSTTSGGSGGS